MILALAPAVRRRPDEIEAAEGIPPVELAHQALEVWSTLTADERRILTFAAMQLVVAQYRRGAT